MEEGLIGVDKWRGGRQAYFLTHLHADHTRGLSSEWAWGPLYCSRTSSHLLHLKFPSFRLSLVRVLPIGTWHSLSFRTENHLHDPLVLQVMAIDAHHCPGAVMFLFRGDFGCRLYTGDFRWEKNSDRSDKARTMLRNALKDDVVDVLYLDNTYCNPKYDFPSREFAARQVVEIINSYPYHDIVIGIDSLGKEDLLLFIANVLNIKIWVWPQRLQTMHLLGYHDMFTTKTSLTRVRAVPRYSFSINTLEGLNKSRPTIGIMPSGLPWPSKPSKKGKLSATGGSGTKYVKLNGNLGSVEMLHNYMYLVPYSDHSCFAEIQELIELVQPTKMIGIVSSSSCYVEPVYYFGRDGGNQMSVELDYKSHVESGAVLAQTNSCECDGSGKPEKAKMKRIPRVLGTRRSGVSALRQVRRGVKIAEDEDLDD